MECLETDKGVGSNTAVGRESGGGAGQEEGQRPKWKTRREEQEREVIKWGKGEGGGTEGGVGKSTGTANISEARGRPAEREAWCGLSLKRCTARLTRCLL